MRSLQPQDVMRMLTAAMLAGAKLADRTITVITTVRRRALLAFLRMVLGSANGETHIMMWSRRAVLRLVCRTAR